MSNRKREPATIDSVFYGKEDHGVLTFSLGMSLGDGGSHQGFGGIVLDEESGAKLCEELCAFFGAPTFDALKGRRCLVLRCFDAWGENIEGVEVDGRRWTLTAFRRRHFPKNAESVLERRRGDILHRIEYLTRDLKRAKQDLATFEVGYTDWETAP